MVQFSGDSASGSGRLTDRIGIGVLTRLVSRELVDEVVAELGRSEQRRRLLPARVVVYFVMGLALFCGDSYEEVMRKLVQGLQWLRIWSVDWTVPTSGALTQARRRLGSAVMRELFERVAVRCAQRSTKGAWLGPWRLMSLDGFDIDIPDSAANAAHFGYAGKRKGITQVAFPKMSVVALAECGTHAIVGAEPGAANEAEIVLATRLLSGGAVTDDMLVIADRGLYSHEHLGQVIDAGADALFRAKADVQLPVLKWLADGSYLSYSVGPRVRHNAKRRLTSGMIKVTDLPGFYVRVIDYEVNDRGDGEETFTIVTTILDPEDASAIELAAAYHERWESNWPSTRSKLTSAAQPPSSAPDPQRWSYKNYGDFS